MYAAISKLLDYRQFRMQLGQSPLLARFSGLVVWAIPTIEIVISVLLIFERTRLLGLLVSFSLMIMFTAYIILITRFTASVPCSCGGILENLSWNEHLIFNVAFALLALIGIVLSYKQLVTRIGKMSTIQE